MEQIILKKAYYPVMDSVLKRKIILYNSEHKILVLNDSRKIKLPKDAYYENKIIDHKIEEILSMQLDDKKMIELVTIINYYSHFVEQNNKLNKISRELINEYYAYNIEFNQDVINSIWNSEYITSNNFLPYIINIDDFIEINPKLINVEDIEAVKTLQKKLKYEII